MISYDISDIIDVIGYVSNRDVSDIIDVMGTCSRVFQGTRWHVMWYHMISVISYDISDIIWYQWYHMIIMLPRRYVLKPQLHQWYHWYHRCNRISYDISDIICYHMISSYSYCCYSCTTYSLPHISYDIIWYHMISHYIYDISDIITTSNTGHKWKKIRSPPFAGAKSIRCPPRT